MEPLRDASARLAGPGLDPGREGRASLRRRLLARGAAHATMLFDVAFWLGAALLAVELARRSITLGDEGYLLNQSLDLASGKVPYRDFDLFVTPGAWLLNALVFSLFGTSVLATRYVAAAALVATMAVCAAVVREALRADLRKPSRGRWSRSAAALVAMLSAWAFPAWTISFYSPYATLAALAGLLFLLRYRHSGRALSLVAAGVFVGVSIAFKQNYGVFAALACAISLAVDRTAPGGPWDDIPRAPLAVELVRLGAGIAAVLGPLALGLVLAGAGPAAWDSLVVRPFAGFREAHSVPYLAFGDLVRRRQVWQMGGLRYLSVPMMQGSGVAGWPQAAIVAAQTLHSLLYWLPWLAFAWAAVLAATRRWREAEPRAVDTVALFAFFVFLGVFPRSDFNHLINVWQPVAVLGVCLAARSFADGRWRDGIVRLPAAAALASLVAAYAGFALLWLFVIVRDVSSPIASPRAGVLAAAPLAAAIDHDVALLRSRTAEGESVFALSGLSMIPFLADRPMPTRYYNYLSVHVGHDAGRGAADEIERSGARTMLIQTFDFFADTEGILDFAPLLADYGRRRFRPELLIDGRERQLLVRRDEPLAATEDRWSWNDCEFGSERLPMNAASRDANAAGVTSAASRAERALSVRRELFVRSLYQWPSAQGRSVARCEVTVPAGASLRFGADLVQPRAAAAASDVAAELWLSRGGTRRRLFADRWQLATGEVGDLAASADHVLGPDELGEGAATIEFLSTAADAASGSAGVAWRGVRLELAATEAAGVAAGLAASRPNDHAADGQR